MARKRVRANGEGTIYTTLRNDKPYYRCQISIGYDKKGRIKRKSFSGHNKQDVLKRMRAYQYKNDTGQLPADSEITLAEWFRTWLFDFRIHDLKPSSFEKYEGIYRNYIEGALVGKIRLTELRAGHLQVHFNQLLESGKSVNVVRTTRQYLGTCLKSALEQRYILSNPCQNVKLPKYVEDEDEGEIAALTKDEQATFLKAIKGNKYEMPMLLTLATGLRLGEMLALKWADINFTKGH